MVDCVCDPLEKEGYGYVQWIGSLLHDCVYTPAERLSVILGLLSLLLWLPALFPQLLYNYRIKTTDALSFAFLFQWLLGDISNLLGCLWTEQLPTQTYTAAYFCFTDLLLLGQYGYYRHWYHRGRAAAQQQAEGEQDRLLADRSNQRRVIPANASSLLSSSKQSSFLIAAISVLALSHVSIAASSPPSSPSPSLPVCNASAALSLSQVVAGCVLSWLSGLLYFTSRFPQILHNFRRRSVSGLSLTLFILSIAANASYGASVLLRVNGGWTEAKFLRATLPFLLGSVGTICLDIIILTQSACYAQRKGQAVQGSGDGDGYEELAEAEQQQQKHPSVEDEQREASMRRSSAGSRQVL
jgi:uncharacterized protein with PQ loop repeat